MAKDENKYMLKSKNDKKQKFWFVVVIEKEEDLKDLKKLYIIKKIKGE